MASKLSSVLGNKCGLWRFKTKLWGKLRTRFCSARKYFSCTEVKTGILINTPSVLRGPGHNAPRPGLRPSSPLYLCRTQLQALQTTARHVAVPSIQFYPRSCCFCENIKKKKNCKTSFQQCSSQPRICLWLWQLLFLRFLSLTISSVICRKDKLASLPFKVLRNHFLPHYRWLWGGPALKDLTIKRV